MTLSADAVKVMRKKVLLLLFLKEKFHPGLLDDEKNTTSYLPVPLTKNC